MTAAPIPLRRFLAGLMLPIVFAAISLAGPALAHGYKLGTVEIGHLWAPPSTDAGTSVYGPLFQSGSASDYLIAASSPLGDAVVLEDKHGATIGWGGGLELKPGEPVSLASFGDHLQVMGLTHPVKEGDSFPLKLTFKKAGSITAEVVVEKTPSE